MVLMHNIQLADNTWKWNWIEMEGNGQKYTRHTSAHNSMEEKGVHSNNAHRDTNKWHGVYGGSGMLIFYFAAYAITWKWYSYSVQLKVGWIFALSATLDNKYKSLACCEINHSTE